MKLGPGSTIGIIGGGQLGRMLALAAARLGYRTHIYAPDEAPPAAEVAACFTRGAYEDETRLRRFAREIDVATFEFENIPTGPLAAFDGLAPLYPPVRALEIAQDRLAEKEFAVSLGARTAAFAVADTHADLEAGLAITGVPALLKTRRMGYDGKGQARIGAASDAPKAYRKLGGAPAVLEALVAFDAEFSVLLCRGQSGDVAFWDSPRNFHENGILRVSRLPPGVSLERPIAAARAVALKIAETLDYVGVLAIEFFAVGEEAWLNELAPRVHNSGHWTIEGATTSQFENHVRAICGLPLGETDLKAPRIEMRNLIGDEASDGAEILADRRAHLHLYGKGTPRAGRKMGHVTRLFAS